MASIESELLNRPERAGRPAIVTGAAQGVGAGIVRALHAAGHPVAVVDLREAPARQMAEALAAGGGAPCIAVAADVRRKEDLDRAVHDTVEELGGLGVIVNNAARTQARPFMEIAVDEWDDVLATNLRSVLLGVQAAVPIMRAQGWGRIINVSSVAGLRGGPQVQGAHYATSKAGIIGLTRYLAHELAPDGITVNAIAPGPVETEQTRLAAPEKLEQVASQIPVGRLGDVSEIGACVAYLASDDAAFIVGATLDINGGLVMR